jgi:hypothetical protein
MDDIFTTVRNYFIEEIAPILNTQYSDYICCIGGSYSYGYADAQSDIDVYLIGNISRQFIMDNLRQHFFKHIDIAGRKVQFVPLLSQHPAFHIVFAQNVYEAVLKCQDIQLLFSIQNYIAVYDKNNCLERIRESIKALDSSYWNNACIMHCNRYIDILEHFYSCNDRNDIMTSLMVFGPALQGILETLHLANRKLYPPVKWLMHCVLNQFPDMYKLITPKQQEISQRGASSVVLKDCIKVSSEFVIKSLKQNMEIPEIILNDFLNP